MEDRKEWCDISNLGGYQWLTTSAKKVGGPVNLVLLIAGSGAAIYKGGEVLVKNSVKAIKKIRAEKNLADQMISIDLDDGVKVNYAKFQDVLAKIK